MSKTTYIYGLYDPRRPEEIRYVGKADNISKRLRQHINDSKKLDNIIGKPLSKELWIRSLLNLNIEPEVKIIEEIYHDNPSEWGDREIYNIAHFIKEGHRLENGAIGGNDNFNIQGVRYRYRQWKQNKNPFTRYKLNEAIMYTRSNTLYFEDAWTLRKDFYSNKAEFIESEFNLRIASHDVNRSRLYKYGGCDCYICGVSISNEAWSKHKHKFMNDSYIPPEEYEYMETDEDKYYIEVHHSPYIRNMMLTSKYSDFIKVYTEDGKLISCNCNKVGKVFLKYSCNLYHKIKSYDKTIILNSDDKIDKMNEYLFSRFKELIGIGYYYKNKIEYIDINPLKMLVVDDYMARLNNVKKLFISYGHKVDIAIGGHNALYKLGKSVYDLIIIQTHMDNSDGVETAKLIRSSENIISNKTPIIALIAPARENNKKRSFCDVFSAYVPFPPKIEYLHRAIVDIAKKDTILSGKIL